MPMIFDENSKLLDSSVATGVLKVLESNLTAGAIFSDKDFDGGSSSNEFAPCSFDSSSPSRHLNLSFRALICSFSF